MVNVKLHTLLAKLANELNKEPNEDKGKVGILVDKCLGRANAITAVTKNAKLQHDYRTALSRLDRHNNASYKNIDNWARVVLNLLMVTFPHRL